MWYYYDKKLGGNIYIGVGIVRHIDLLKKRKIDEFFNSLFASLPLYIIFFLYVYEKTFIDKNIARIFLIGYIGYFIYLYFSRNKDFKKALKIDDNKIGRIIGSVVFYLSFVFHSAALLAVYLYSF